MMSETIQGPHWLGPFLKGNYFSSCKAHAAARKNEKNYFCTTCLGESLCHTCVQKHHHGLGHKVLQVRKSSYHEAVRIEDLQKSLDLKSVQPYVINDARIVFLNKRPQGRHQKGDHSCEVCDRNLMDPCRFCSLGCKFEAAKSDSSASLHVTHHVYSPVSVLPGKDIFQFSSCNPIGLHIVRKKRTLREVVQEEEDEERMMKKPFVNAYQKPLLCYASDSS